VALGAGRDFAGRRHLVRIGKRETGGRVIEYTVGPDRDGVTSGACWSADRELCRHVVGNIAAEGLRTGPGRLVATHAIRRTQRVIVVDVAGDAGRRRGRHVRAGEREACRGVVERGDVGPGNGVVAGRAIGSREGRARGRVRRVIGLLPGGQVAAGIAAVGRRDLQVVIAVDVAGGAEHVGMAVGESEAGGTVVEYAVCPSGDGVASGTSRSRGRESCRDVIGNVAAEGLCAVPGGQVATHAIGGTQGVIVVDVTGGAGRRRGGHVRAGEREARWGMVERGDIGPGNGVVAGRAIGSREGRAWGRVRRVIGLLPGSQVATGIAAVGRRDLQVVVIVDVARSARNVGMAIGQQETSGAVIESGSRPRDRVVAAGTIGNGEGRPGFGVRGVVRLLPSAEVAAGVAAIGGRDLQVVVIVDVARSARKVGVSIGQ